MLALGGSGVAWLAAAVALTIGFGLAMARALGLPARFGLISGGATGICGISAALAISSALPRVSRTEQQTLMTAIGVAAVHRRHGAVPAGGAGAATGRPAGRGAVFWWRHPRRGAGGGAGAILSPEVAQSATPWSRCFASPCWCRWCCAWR